jgi:hypothetical protein
MTALLSHCLLQKWAGLSLQGTHSFSPGSFLWFLELTCFEAGIPIYWNTYLIVLLLLYSSSTLSWRFVFCRTLSRSILTLTVIDFSSQSLTLWLRSTLKHLLVLISGCSTESPMQRSFYLFIFIFKYWVTDFYLGSVSEFARELCRNRDDVPRNYDLGWTELHLYNVLWLFQRHW